MLSKKLQALCRRLEGGAREIQPDRLALLQEMAAKIALLPEQSGGLEVIVICTHNSRRSQLGQLLLQLAAFHYGLPEIQVYSGGTAATGVYKSIVEALRRVGFVLEAHKENGYRLELEGRSLNLFSKVYDHPANPTSQFVAVMVCSDADEGCPVVRGAALRFSLPYTDPKLFDGSPEEQSAYDAKLGEIGREMFYLAGKIRAYLNFR